MILPILDWLLHQNLFNRNNLIRLISIKNDNYPYDFIYSSRQWIMYLLKLLLA